MSKEKITQTGKAGKKGKGKRVVAVSQPLIVIREGTEAERTAAALPSPKRTAVARSA